MTKLTIDIGELTRDESDFTVDHCIATLEATTSLTHLEVVFDCDNPNDPRIVEQLGQCISNLKRRNENHPLVTIELFAPKSLTSLMISLWPQNNLESVT